MAANRTYPREGATNAVGQQIRQLRLRSHLTQTELARRIGIQQSDLSRMEKGEYRVPLNVLFQILGVLQVSLAEFFGETPPFSLSQQEAKLIQVFRSLDEDRRRAVEEFAAFQLDRQATEE